mmetsp:Transcript_118244/g.376936  ORF Transcript_118244/g.376936 Transcript_118244/m.376936 type:complete len:300 (-) Transcript_118244:76-975(-)
MSIPARALLGRPRAQAPLALARFHVAALRNARCHGRPTTPALALLLPLSLHPSAVAPGSLPRRRLRCAPCRRARQARTHVRPRPDLSPAVPAAAAAARQVARRRGRRARPAAAAVAAAVGRRRRVRRPWAQAGEVWVPASSPPLWPVSVALQRLSLHLPAAGVAARQAPPTMAATACRARRTVARAGPVVEGRMRGTPGAPRDSVPRGAAEVLALPAAARVAAERCRRRWIWWPPAARSGQRPQSGRLRRRPRLGAPEVARRPSSRGSSRLCRWRRRAGPRGRNPRHSQCQLSSLLIVA